MAESRERFRNTKIFMKNILKLAIIYRLNFMN